MDVNLPKLLLDYRLETKKGASRRRVTQVVHDPDLPPFAAPTLESWESSKKILGRGGQGEVLLQKCISGPRCNSMRALKVIRCFDDGARRRHVRELETMVRFSHERVRTLANDMANPNVSCKKIWLNVYANTCACLSVLEVLRQDDRLVLLKQQK